MSYHSLGPCGVRVEDVKVVVSTRGIRRRNEEGLDPQHDFSVLDGRVDDDLAGQAQWIVAHPALCGGDVFGGFWVARLVGEYHGSGGEVFDEEGPCGATVVIETEHSTTRSYRRLLTITGKDIFQKREIRYQRYEYKML